jgi:signal transduction histidine kinase/ligand-binding sensor domain-containing protein
MGVCFSLCAPRGLDAQAGGTPTPAFPPEQSIFQMTHKSWTFQDGFPNNPSGVDIGPDGLIWIAADTGLFRFDGISFERYTPSAGSLLQSDHLQTIATAADGSVWISYIFGGVSKIAGGTVTNFTQQDGLGSGQIRSIVVDKTGLVWLAGTDGLYTVTGSKIRRVGSESGLPPGGLGILVLDESENLWVSLPDRIMIRAAGQTRFQTVALLGNRSMVNCSYLTADGVLCGDRTSIWSTHLRYASGHLIESKSDNLSSISAIFGAKDGSFWLSREGHGISHVPKAWLDRNLRVSSGETFDVRNGLTSDYVWRIAEDGDGSIWILTARGLDQFRPNAVHVIETSPTPGMAITNREPDSQTILGTDRLWAVTNGQIKQITGRFCGGVRSLYGAVDGSIWIGADDKLFHFFNGKVAVQTMPPDLKNPLTGVQSITEDSRHGLWVSLVRNGVFRLYRNAWLRKGGYSELPDAPAVSTGRDRSGNVWLGYLDGRVASISASGQVHLYGSTTGPKVGSVKVFSQLGSEFLIGGDEGVAILHNGKFHHLILSDSSGMRGVTGLTLAPNGDLWINGSAGIIRVSNSDLAAASANDEYKSPFQLFDYHKGVQGSPSSIASLSSAFGGSDGKLYFVMRDHLDWIDPKQNRLQSAPPKVTVDEVRYDNEAVAWPTGIINLGPRPLSLRIRFKVGSLLIPDQVRFRYRLDNYDRGWVEAGNRHEAEYAKLPPGRYTFHVLAANDAGIWSDTGTSIGFAVPPTFSQTIWFELSLFLALIGAVYFAFRIRLDLTRRRVANQMYGILAERQQIARDLHDTLLQSVQALMFKMSVATKKLSESEPVRPLLEGTLAQSDRVLMDGRKLIDGLNTEEEPVSCLLDFIRTISDDLRTAYPSVQYAVEAEGTECIISAVVNREVGMFAREALTNAFRHAEARNIRLNLVAGSKELRLQVKDDGCGIDEEILTRGYRSGHWGLRNMRERAERLGAKYILKSSPEAGTSIEIVVQAYMAYPRQPNDLRARLQALWRNAF